MRMLIAVFMVLLASPVIAQEPIAKIYGGVNGLWYEGIDKFPPDFELGLNGRASLSPHLSVVAAAFYGIGEAYSRGSAGIRVTATDALDPDFSVGFGIQRHASDDPGIRPEEWAPDASVGWRPWPVLMPHLVVGAQGSYGLTSNQASVLVAARYHLLSFGRGK